MDSRSDLKRKTGGGAITTPPPTSSNDGFVKVQKRKQRKLERHRPQFQYDTSYFRSGKKIGIAVSNTMLYVLMYSISVTCRYSSLRTHSGLLGW